MCLDRNQTAPLWCAGQHSGPRSHLSSVHHPVAEPPAPSQPTTSSICTGNVREPGVCKSTSLAAGSQGSFQSGSTSKGVALGAPSSLRSEGGRATARVYEHSLQAAPFPECAPHSPLSVVLMAAMKRVQASAHLESRVCRDAQQVGDRTGRGQGCSASGSRTRQPAR